MPPAGTAAARGGTVVGMRSIGQFSLWLAEQGGIAHTTVARESGFTTHGIRCAVATGAAERVRRSWLASPNCDWSLRRAALSGGRVTCLTQAERAGLWTPIDRRGDPAAGVARRSSCRRSHRAPPGGPARRVRASPGSRSPSRSARGRAARAAGVHRVAVRLPTIAVRPRVRHLHHRCGNGAGTPPLASPQQEKSRRQEHGSRIRLCRRLLLSSGDAGPQSAKPNTSSSQASSKARWRQAL